MGRIDEAKLRYITEKLQELKFGTVHIIVHDDEITQIDITEKKRYPLTKKRNDHTLRGS